MTIRDWNAFRVVWHILKCTDLFLVFSTEAALYGFEHGRQNLTEVTSQRITCDCRQDGQRTRVHGRRDELKNKVGSFDDNNATSPYKRCHVLAGTGTDDSVPDRGGVSGQNPEKS